MTCKDLVTINIYIYYWERHITYVISAITPTNSWGRNMETEILSKKSDLFKVPQMTDDSSRIGRWVCGQEGEASWIWEARKAVDEGREPWAMWCLGFTLINPGAARVSTGRGWDLTTQPPTVGGTALQKRSGSALLHQSRWRFAI